MKNPTKKSLSLFDPATGKRLTGGGATMPYTGHTTPGGGYVYAPYIPLQMTTAKPQFPYFEETYSSSDLFKNFNSFVRDIEWEGDDVIALRHLFIQGKHGIFVDIKSNIWKMHLCTFQHPKMKNFLSDVYLPSNQCIVFRITEYEVAMSGDGNNTYYRAGEWEPLKNLGERE